MRPITVPRCRRPGFLKLVWPEGPHHLPRLTSPHPPAAPGPRAPPVARPVPSLSFISLFRPASFCPPGCAHARGGEGGCGAGEFTGAVPALSSPGLSGSSKPLGFDLGVCPGRACIARFQQEFPPPLRSNSSFPTPTPPPADSCPLPAPARILPELSHSLAPDP